jgi:hypothetical protein
MSDWQRLSVRDGRAADDGPYDGVPGHLYLPLREWVDSNFGGSFGSQANHTGGPRLMAAARLPIALAQDRGKITVREVTGALFAAPDLMLDVVDAALHLSEFYEWQLDPLNEILELGGSVWQVDSNGRRLVRRVDATAQAAFRDASSPDDLASAELQEAWTAAYGRNPNASDAWDHSIKAVEAVLIPVVTPKKAKANLGDVVGSLNGQGSLWKLVLHGHDDTQSVAPLVTMLRLMWPNPDRHGGGDNSRKPSREEAQAVVNLAVAIVQWARAGALSRV